MAFREASCKLEEVRVMWLVLCGAVFIGLFCMADARSRASLVDSEAPDSKVAACNYIECPSYRVVHKGAGFEVRQYAPATWMVKGPIPSMSFNAATTSGFRSLFKYIQGDNLNNTRVEMTAPVLTSIVPSDGPFCYSAFSVQFLVPGTFNGIPPLPSPESGLASKRWASPHCVVVSQFGGYALNENVAVEASALAQSLNGTQWEPVLDIVRKQGEAAYSIAQYNGPLQVWGRVNEVWVDFDAQNAEASDSQCLPAPRQTESESGAN